MANENKLKIGSDVLICSNYNNTLGKIERETKIYWVVNATKFRKDSLYRSGDDSWSTTRIKPITLEEKNKYLLEQKRLKLAQKIKEQSFYDLTLEQLQEIKKILDTHNTSKDKK